jgi:SAM-dependent methyltransferase
MSEIVDRLLRAHYRSPRVAEVYAGSAALKPAESAILARLHGDIAGGRLLDLGMGAGRTAPGLRAVSTRYVGIDYSLPMLARCRARFPGVPLVLCDAQALAFRPGSFDAAFCWDALGDAGHQGRARMLREAWRVLRPGGWLALRANNLDAPRRSPFALPARAARGLRGGLAALTTFLRGVRHHLRTRRHEQTGEGYRVAGDPFFDFALLSYYVRREAQVRQLEEIGFTAVQALGSDGSPAGGGTGADPFLFYLARRA